MKLASDFRRENLEALAKEAGSLEKLAAASGLSPVYLSQIRKLAPDLKTGRPRNLGNSAARKIEVGMGKAKGWMDSSHHDAQSPFSPEITARLQALSAEELECVHRMLVAMLDAQDSIRKR